MIKISVVICTYNRVDVLHYCIDSLINQSLNEELYEVIVINNNSTDNTDNVVKRYSNNYPFIHMFNEKKQGLSHARNRGYLESRGIYVAYIVDDAQATPEWLENIIQAFETITPQPCVVGGQIYPFYLTKKPDWFLDEYEIRSNGGKSKFIRNRNGIINFSGSNMTFKKKILKKYNGFSPHFGIVGKSFRAGEEIEFFKKIYKDSHCFWYDTNVIVRHLVPKEKMSVKYILYRCFWSGYNYQQIYNEKLSYVLFIYKFIQFICRIGFNCFLLIWVKWWKKGWQNDFLRHSSIIIGCIGNIIALFEKKYNINILV